MPDRSELILRLTHTLARIDSSDDPLPKRLCTAFVDVVSAETGAISLGFTAADRSILCATTEVARRYEDAQDLVREGPSLDAISTGRVVSATAADHTARWPELAQVLGGHTPAAVHAIPMRPAETIMGVLTVHHLSAPAALDDVGPELPFLSAAVGAAILGGLPSGVAESRLWSERDRISQATGMVVAQLGLVAHDALAVMRAHAFAREWTMPEVSRRIIARDLDFRRDEDDS